MTSPGQVRPGFIEKGALCQTLGLGIDGGDKELEMTIGLPRQRTSRTISRVRISKLSNQIYCIKVIESSIGI